MSSENTPTHKRTTDEIKTLLELPFRAAEITWLRRFREVTRPCSREVTHLLGNQELN
jgi:hypothetical protein